MALTSRVAKIEQDEISQIIHGSEKYQLTQGKETNDKIKPPKQNQIEPPDGDEQACVLI